MNDISVNARIMADVFRARFPIQSADSAKTLILDLLNLENGPDLAAAYLLLGQCMAAFKLDLNGMDADVEEGPEGGNVYFADVTWESFQISRDNFVRLLDAACDRNDALKKALESITQWNDLPRDGQFLQLFTEQLMTFLHDSAWVSVHQGKQTFEVNSSRAPGPTFRRITIPEVKIYAVLLAGCLDLTHWDVDIRLNLSECMEFVSIAKPDRRGNGLIGMAKWESKDSHDHHYLENGFLPLATRGAMMPEPYEMWLTSKGQFVHCDGARLLGHITSQEVRAALGKIPSKSSTKSEKPSVPRSKAKFGTRLLEGLFSANKLTGFPACIAEYGAVNSFLGLVDHTEAEHILLSAIDDSQIHKRNAYVLPYRRLAEHYARKNRPRMALVSLLYASAVVSSYDSVVPIDNVLVVDVHSLCKMLWNVCQQIVDPDVWTTCNIIGFVDNYFVWEDRASFYSAVEHGALGLTGRPEYRNYRQIPYPPQTDPCDFIVKCLKRVCGPASSRISFQRTTALPTGQVFDSTDVRDMPRRLDLAKRFDPNPPVHDTENPPFMDEDVVQLACHSSRMDLLVEDGHVTAERFNKAAIQDIFCRQRAKLMVE